MNKENKIRAKKIKTFKFCWHCYKRIRFRLPKYTTKDGMYLHKRCTKHYKDFKTIRSE